MKLWQKKKTSVTKQVDRFTVGADRLWDVRLAPYDVLASKAHAQMLADVGLLTAEEAKARRQCMWRRQATGGQVTSGR